MLLECILHAIDTNLELAVHDERVHDIPEQLGLCMRDNCFSCSSGVKRGACMQAVWRLSCTTIYCPSYCESCTCLFTTFLPDKAPTQRAKDQEDISQLDENLLSRHRSARRPVFFITRSTTKMRLRVPSRLPRH